MAVPNAQDTFLSDLSLAHATGRAALRVLERGADEVADERARALLSRHAGEIRAQIRGLEQVFALLAAAPQDLGCPALDGIRQELDLFRQLDPAPEFLTAMTLFVDLKIEHNEIAAYRLLIDHAVLLGQVEAARMLTTIAQPQEETAAKIGWLIHELLLEVARDTEPAKEAAAAGRGPAPHATASAG